MIHFTLLIIINHEIFDFNPRPPICLQMQEIMRSDNTLIVHLQIKYKDLNIF